MLNQERVSPKKTNFLIDGHIAFCDSSFFSSWKNKKPLLKSFLSKIDFWPPYEAITLQIFKVPPQVLIFYYIKIHKYQGTFSQDKYEDEKILSTYFVL